MYGRVALEGIKEELVAENILESDVVNTIGFPILRQDDQLLLPCHAFLPHSLLVTETSCE